MLAFAWMVLPRWIGSGNPASAGSGPAIRVLTANLLFGRADPEAMLALVRDHQVDVLTLQEYTMDAEAALDRAGIAALLPYRESHPAGGGSGSAVYARFPLHDGGVRTNPCGFLQAYAIAAVPGARPVVVESAHPAAPSDMDNLDCWRADLAGQPGADDAPATRTARCAYSPATSTRQWTTGRSRRLIGRGLPRRRDDRGQGTGGHLGPVRRLPRIPPVTIDHVLVDRRVGVRAVSVHRIPGSDHRAVLAELKLPG